MCRRRHRRAAGRGALSPSLAVAGKIAGLVGAILTATRLADGAGACRRDLAGPDGLACAVRVGGKEHGFHAVVPLMRGSEGDCGKSVECLLPRAAVHRVQVRQYVSAYENDIASCGASGGGSLQRADARAAARSLVASAELVLGRAKAQALQRSWGMTDRGIQSQI